MIEQPSSLPDEKQAVYASATPWPGIMVNGYKLSSDARFVPWPLPKMGGSSKSALGTGFVSDSRFSGTDRVIPRTNRNTTRKWRKVGQ